MQKRLLLILAGLSAILIVKSAMAAVSVYCEGSLCTETSGGVQRAYMYEVVLTNAGGIQLEVGTHDTYVADYTNWVVELKTGGVWTDVTSQWSESITADGGWQDSPFTPHGSISTPTGVCPAEIVWSQHDGATQGTDFLFGYDNPNPLHDATWYVAPGLGSADWTQPVGMGQGPVHSPGPVPEPGSLLLLAGAGFGLFLRRR
jgi:hypothetical protein